MSINEKVKNLKHALSKIELVKQSTQEEYLQERMERIEIDIDELVEELRR